MGQERSFSRRAFARGFSALTAGLTVPIITESALAQRDDMAEFPAGAVLLNSNENPLGPCPEAIEVMTGILKRGGRYLDWESVRMARTLAEVEGLPPDHVQAFAGSSDPLHRTVLAYTAPGRCYVGAAPGYEAGVRASRYTKAEVHEVPLTSTYAHDVRGMLAAAGGKPGVFYVCNPNNPSGTLTPKQDIEFLVANKPAGSIVMIDEAYIHFCDAQPCTDMVKSGKDVIILRTFSKLYGMAGLRAGAAMARPDILEKLRPLGTWFLPTTAMAGATASLRTKGLVAQRKQYMKDNRESVFDWMSKQGYSFVPSVSNKFMVNVNRPGRDVINALAAQNVFIGRTWPCWPTYVRVTIGTRDEMLQFQSAFQRVMS